MYYDLFEKIAADYSGLRQIIEKLDSKLALCDETGLIDPRLIASLITEDTEEVEKILDLCIENQGIIAEWFVECENCSELMPLQVGIKLKTSKNPYSECLYCSQPFETSGANSFVMRYRLAMRPNLALKAEATTESTEQLRRPAVPVFVCAADSDVEQFKELRQHLGVAIQQNELRLWHPSECHPGSDRRTEAAQHFAESRVILLLVSARLWSNPEVVEQIDSAMKRSKLGLARVVPVFLSSIDTNGASFAGLVALPRNNLPISQWDDRDAAWVEVVKELRNMLQRS